MPNTFASTQPPPAASAIRHSPAATGQRIRPAPIEGGTHFGAEALCDPGDVATGGGFVTNGAILTSLVGGEGRRQGWQSTATDEEGTSGVKTSVVCVDNPPFRA